jgi:hypothetical protein
LQKHLLALITQFSTYDEERLKGLLKSQQADERFAASYVVGENKVPLPRDMIALLGDSSPVVQQSARRSLILLAWYATGPRKPCTELTRQVNNLLRFGPEPTLNKTLIARAATKWNTWWDQNDPSLRKLTSMQSLTAGNALPAPNKPAPVVMTPEDIAHTKLNVAKMFAKDGLLDKAKLRYEQIQKDYPGTAAASEATQLLDKMKESTGKSTR